MAFAFGQWNNRTWRKQHSIPPGDEVFPAEVETELSETAKCGKCGSDNLRPAGWFTSKLWEEKHQDVQCRACGKYSRLPVGVVLPKAERSARPNVPVLEANDTRPFCPHCNANTRIHRRDLQPAFRVFFFKPEWSTEFEVIALENAAALEAPDSGLRVLRPTA
jgi:hypothetical protein